MRTAAIVYLLSALSHFALFGVIQGFARGIGVGDMLFILAVDSGMIWMGVQLFRGTQAARWPAFWLSMVLSVCCGTMPPCFGMCPRICGVRIVITLMIRRLATYGGYWLSATSRPVT